MNFQPPIASNATLHDSEALRARMQEIGYLFFRGLVNPTHVLNVRREVLQILSRYGILDSSVELIKGRMGDGSTPTRHELLTLHREINKLESFNSLAHAPEILSLMYGILEGEALVHTRKICRLKYPNDDYDLVLPHQDYFYIRGSLETYSAWLPLGDIDISIGGLAVAPKSHLRGFLPHEKSATSRFTGVNPKEADCVWHRSDYAPGDVLIFHSLTLHQGLPNRSDRVRLSVDYRYQREGTELEPSHLKPHFEDMTAP